ncbi:BnaA04g27400D [Brassica napus]|uniref:BnaA04g27400D protein n=2 Tax=Brassica napus TaxID=3708 RepID=A0A078IY72_BRANA|nr:BnaA04g27400D [Brassica napus]
MASPSSYTKHPSPPRSTTAAATPPSASPTGGGFFSKPILLGMFLLALPLFPSQAPDFVGETVLTKLWELIHLLFVGIAVAYGLFSRRNVGESNVESRVSCVDESSLSYVSGILQASSVFDEEEEEETNKSEYAEINQVQAWNSRYSQGRSKVVVVARPAYGLDGHVVHQSLGLPVRSLRSALEEEKEKAEEESLADDDDEVVAEMMAMGDDETRFTTRSSVSSSSSRTSFESNDQKNRYSPSRSVSGESLNSNVEEKSLQGSSRCSSPSLPPSPSPEIVTDETHRRVLHSQHYSDGSLLEEGVRRGFVDELEGPGSKSLKLLSDESSLKGKSKSRRSYPPDLTLSPPVDGADRSTTRRRYLQQKSDSHLFEKGLESEHHKMSVKKVRSHDSLEFKPRNDKASRRSSRGGSETLVVKDNKRNSEDDDDSEDYDDNKEVISNRPRCEPQSWRGSSKVSSIGKSVRTIRSDSSDDRAGRRKPRRQWQQELAIVLHQEKHSETLTTSEPEDDDDDDVMEESEAEQPDVTLEEEEEEVAAVWESQSNASNEHYEVDKKADEFIAKFREQIRLQKLHSGEQRRGGGTGVIRNIHFR